MTCVSTATYSLLKNLVRLEKPLDKSLDELSVLLKSHFEPSIIVIAERFHFYQRLQKEGETITNYMTELRRPSKHRNFGDYLDQRRPNFGSSQLLHWALLLSAYKYKLKFKSGVDNKEADLLSGLPKAVQMIDPNEEIYHVDYCDQLPVTATEIARETQRDSILRKAYEYTQSGWRTSEDPCLEPYARQSTDLSIDNGAYSG